jgi:hypothetical protein
MPPAIIGALISGVMGAGSADIQGRAARRSQQRIAEANLKYSREQAREKRVASSQEVEAQRQSDVSSDRLAKAKGRQISSSALSQRGIASRPITSFSDIGKSVLDEGNND